MDYGLVDFADPRLGEGYIDMAEDYGDYTAALGKGVVLDREFAHNALVQLANASVALAALHGLGEQADIMAEAQIITTKFDLMLRDPDASTQVVDLRGAALSIAQVLSAVQEVRYPALDAAVAELAQKADAIDPNTIIIDQQELLKDYFRSARSTLISMNQLAYSAQ